jgi:hypothetical protein
MIYLVEGTVQPAVILLCNLLDLFKLSKWFKHLIMMVIQKCFLLSLLFFIYISELKLSQIFCEVWNFHYLIS